MRDHASTLSVNEPHTSRQSFTPFSINEPPALPDLDMPAPVISSIAPTEAKIGDATFTLVVSGDNFFAGTVLNFATHDEPTTHDGDTVSTIIDMDYWHGPDAIPVYVHNGDKVSNEMIFTFLPPDAIEGTQTETEATGNPDIDYRDPDEMEDELEQAQEEGDYEPTHTVSVKKTTVKVKKK